MDKYKKIKCAAIKQGDVVMSGLRHCDCFHNLAQAKINHVGAIQGFIDYYNTFFTREEAAFIAFEYGQIKEPKKELFSEDLY